MEVITRRISSFHLRRFICAMVFFVMSISQSNAEGYQLDTKDVIRIKVLIWHLGTGEYVELEPLADQFTVGSDGALSLPILGSVPARNRTPTEIAKTISSELKIRMRLANEPSVAIEVTEYRPIYVMGDVAKPGLYAYQPGVSAIQAVALAGGLFREAAKGPQRMRREFINASGAFTQAQLEHRRSLILRARLRAELADKTTIETPEQLFNDGDLRALVDDQHAILIARRKALVSKRVSLDSLKTLLRNQINSLIKKRQSLAREKQLLLKEQSRVKKLLQRRLARASRELEVEQLVGAMESRSIDVESALLKARQDLSKADRDLLDLESQWEGDLVAELQLTEAKIEQAAARMDTAKKLIVEAADNAAIAEAELEGIVNRVPSFSIIRRASSGQSFKMNAGEETELEPADVVKVEMIIEPTSTATSPKKLSVPRREMSDVRSMNTIELIGQEKADENRQHTATVGAQSFTSHQQR